MDKNYKNENGLSLIDWIRGLYNSMDDADKREAELFFPELKESEDEKIRRALVNYFSTLSGCLLIQGINIEKIRAWIEKQKIISDNLKANGVVIRDDGSIEKHTIGYLTKPKEQNPSDLVTALKHHLETTPKEQLEKEWKELDHWGNIGPTIHEFLYGEHLSPEWSAEDEKKLSAVISLMKSSRAVDPFYDKMCLEGWLKSIKPQNTTVNDEELTQAKKEAYKHALDKIEYHSGEPTFDDGWSAAIWYLKEKNAQPRFHWKPSEEQMIYLKEAINKFDFCDAENEGLRALYEQLKTL